MGIILEGQKDALRLRAYATRAEMGAAAGAAAAGKLRALLEEKDEVNVIFAAAPSQNEALAALAAAEGIDWGRVNAFHMDEYVGLPAGHPATFGRYLDEHIFSRVPFKTVHYLRGDAPARAECERYAALLEAFPADLVMLGIGENGHIAFNDPWVADLEDPLLVKEVQLDEVCRMQQVHDGCFSSLDSVPTHALTLTVPALARAAHLVCTVPAASKARAVAATWNGPVSADVPATVMRRHPDAVLFCDADSAALLL